jgi:hypothetical protein
VLDRLNPAERLAFVLHDVFAVPFEDIAEIIDRTPEAARQLASRARRRVQAQESAENPNRSLQRKVVDAFLAALGSGDLERLLAVLDPDVAVRIDEAAVRPGAPRRNQRRAELGRGAIAFSQAVQFAQPALVNGSVGIVFAPRGKLSRVLSFTVINGKISNVEIIADPLRLRELDLAVLG